MGQVWEAQVGKGFTKKKGSPRIWFIQSQPEARVCHSLPERERKVRSGGPSAVSLGTQGHGPLFRLRTGGASLWDQIKTLIEGNFQREWFKLFLVRSAIFKCSLEVLISILSLQIKIIMFSKGPVVYCGEGSLAWFSSMKLPGLWRFSLIWRENLSPEIRVCPALMVSQSSRRRCSERRSQAHFRDTPFHLSSGGYAYQNVLKAKEHYRIAQSNTTFYDDRNVFHLHCTK